MNKERQLEQQGLGRVPRSGKKYIKIMYEYICNNIVSVCILKDAIILDYFPRQSFTIFNTKFIG